MKFTVMGYTVETVEQARTILLVAKLQGRQQVVGQCMSILRQFGAA